MTVTFYGHSDFVVTKESAALLEAVLKALTEEGARRFLCDTYGNFDGVCYCVLKELKKEYDGINLVFVSPYLSIGKIVNQDYVNRYDETVFPPIERTPLKFAIVKRNECMVDNSDVVVAHVEYGCRPIV